MPISTPKYSFYVYDGFHNTIFAFHILIMKLFLHSILGYIWTLDPPNKE